ncbi:MAG: hypothetical protein HY514_04680 [Candidatus Aenigmarchaeota archaeon]|nr:hypothetical protein [Candidatus Aenigmarchaeota archaeon]
MERKELLMTLMIGVLLLTTAMQTVSLASLSNGPAPVTAKSVASSPTPSSSAHSTSGSSAGSLANLPSMVGGC